jgi:hypothetical protein
MVVALALAVGISTAEAERRPCALALALTVYAAVDLNGDASNFTAFLQASPVVHGRRVLRPLVGPSSLT